MSQLRNHLIERIKEDGDKVFFYQEDKAFSLNDLKSKSDSPLFIASELSHSISNLIDGIINNRRLIAIDPNSPSLNDLKERAKKIPQDFNGIIVFTSGSGGSPKAQALSYDSFFFSALGTNEHYNISSRDKLGLSLPLNHVGGILIIIRAIISGASICKLDNKNFTASLITFKPTLISLVSTQLKRLVEDKRSSEVSNFIRGIILGGAPTSQALLKKAVDQGYLLSNSYGSTEVCAQALATPLTKDLNILKTVGKPLKYRQVNLGPHNEIEISGDVLRSHSSDSQKSEVFKSHDIAQIDQAGNYLILGRSDHIFNSGGELINPQEIETAILKKFNFSEALLTSSPHPDFDLSPICYIETNHFVAQKELRSNLKKYIESYKVPKTFIQTKDLSFLESGIKLNRTLAKNLAPKFGRFKKSFFGYPSNPVVILLHGFMGDKDDWLEAVSHLSDNFFCVCVDLPGHGEDVNLDYANFDNFISCLKEDLNSTFKCYDILGYSQGGRIAVGLFHKNPNAKKLIIESANLGLGDEKIEARKKIEDKFLKDISTEKELNAYLRNWYEMPIFKNMSLLDNFEKFLLKDYTKIPLWKSSLSILSLSNQRDYWKEEIDFKRVTVIHGELDDKYSQISKKIESLGAKRLSIEKASHNTHAMNLQSFLEAINSCLKA